jgi:O-antigen/teichoic acid export membrane protein
MIKKLKNRILRLDEHTLEVVNKSSSSLIVKIGGLIAAFTISIILGRTIGPEGLGIINLSNRVIAIVLIFSMAGMNNVLLKEIAISYERKDWQHIANVIYTALRINLPLALVFSLVFILLTPWLTVHLFNEPSLKTPLIIVLLVVVPQTLSGIFASGINGYRKIWQSNLVNDTLSAGIVALGLLVLLLFKIEITVINVAILYAIGRVSVTTAMWLYWSHLFQFKGKRTMQTRSMMKVALPLLLVSATTMIASNADTLMLGWLSNMSEVGFYSVAASLGLFTIFFHVLTISTLTPKIAVLYGKNKTAELQKMLQQVTKGLIFIGLAGVIVFVLGGKYILNLWGNEFTVAYLPLVIISVGQFFNIATGATGIVLIMTGHEKIIGKITFLSAIINLILNYFLIPIYGALGAAIATGSTVTVENIIKVIVVKQKTGILTVPFLNKHY